MGLVGRYRVPRDWPSCIGSPGRRGIVPPIHGRIRRESRTRKLGKNSGNRTSGLKRVRQTRVLFSLFREEPEADTPKHEIPQQPARANGVV
jgi:hypothetical protein